MNKSFHTQHNFIFLWSVWSFLFLKIFLVLFFFSISTQSVCVCVCECVCVCVCVCSLICNIIYTTTTFIFYEIQQESVRHSVYYVKKTG